MKRNLLYLLGSGLLSMAAFFLLPACQYGLYQPRVPEHLQDK